jgi:hypothetical protein
MSSENVGNLDEQYLGTFIKFYSKRYEQWKKKNLLAVALETMPKQVDAANVIDNLIRLKCEFPKRLSYEG